MEVERKFLIKNIPFNLDDYDHKEIEQSYISYEPETRLRKLDDKYYLTKKSNGTLVREEDEKTISNELYNELIVNKLNNTIIKRRYYKPYNDLLIEFDIYKGILEGLMVAEVEFDSIEDSKKFIIPSWFYKEITNDTNFKNKNLSLINSKNIDNFKELMNEQ